MLHKLALLQHLAEEYGWSRYNRERMGFVNPAWITLTRGVTKIIINEGSSKSGLLWMAKEDHSALYGVRYLPNRVLDLNDPNSLNEFKEFLDKVLRIDEPHSI